MELTKNSPILVKENKEGELDNKKKKKKKGSRKQKGEATGGPKGRAFFSHDHSGWQKRMHLMLDLLKELMNKKA